MKTKPYLATSGLIFFLVGLVHLLRLYHHWDAQLGSWVVPVWVSYVGLAAAWGLSGWSIILHRR
jgi:hypothetical protein